MLSDFTLKYIARKLHGMVFFMLFLMYSAVYSQTTIMLENVGPQPIGSTTPISSYALWTNGIGCVMTGVGNIPGNLTPYSTGQYAGASGNAPVNLVTQATSGGVEQWWEISNINTSDYTTLALSLGVYKKLTTANGSLFLIEVSTDGASYTPLTFTALPSGGGTQGWYLVAPTGTIPSTPNLRIRFRNTSAIANEDYRLDDVKLTGTLTCAPGASIGGSISAAATVCPGANGATLTLSGHAGSVTGWESSLDNFATAGTPIVNTTTSLIYSNLTQTTSYRALVKNGTCSTVYSSPVTITVSGGSVGGSVDPPGTACSGANGGTMTLTGQTGSITGWEYSYDNFATAGVPFANTNNSYNYANITQTTSYRAVVKNGACPSVYSSSNTITVSSVTVGGTVNSAATVCSGSNGATLNLTGQIGSVTRWESSLDNFGTAGTPIVNTTTSLTYSNLTQTTSYRAVVQSGSCGVVNSSNVTITVTAAPTLSSATTLSRCTGVSATYTATSATGTATFSWTRAVVAGISNGAGSGAAAAATETLVNTTTSPVDVVYVYTLTANGCSNPQNVTVTVNPTTVINTQPIAASICSGNNVSFTVGVTGAGLTYIWKENGVNLSDGGIYSGTGTATLNLTGATSAQHNKAYSVFVAGSCGSILSSNPLLIVKTIPAIGTQPGNRFPCDGGNANFSVAATGNSLLYQWQENGVNISDGGEYSGTTTSSLTLTGVTFAQSGNLYRVIIGNGCLPDATSNNATLNVFANLTPSISISISTVSNPACSGASVTFTSSISNGGTTPSFQWMVNGVNAGANSSSFTTSSLAIGDVVSCVLTSSASCVTSATATSNNITMAISPVSIGGTVSAPANVCSGANGATVNLTGQTGSVTGWESSLDNFVTAGTPVVNTTTSLTYSNLTQTTSYRAVVKSGGCASANSSPVTITVTPVSVGGTVSVAASVCTGSNGATLNLTGQTGSVTGWESSLDNFATAGTPVVNTSTSLTYSNLTQTTSYRAIVQSGSCASANSSPVTITVTPSSVGGSVNAAATVCSGSNGATVNLTGATGSVTGWESSLDNFATAGTPVVNTTTSLTYSNLTQTTSYRAIVQSGSCASANSSSVTITVTPSSVGGSVNAAATVCSGSNGATVNLTGATGSVTGWESSLDNFATAGTPVVNTTTSLTYSNLTQTTSYRAVVQNGSCASANSSSVTISVTPVSAGGTVSAAAVVCSGSNGATLNLTGQTGSVTGWESSFDNFGTAGTPIVNTTASLTYSNLTQTTSYRAVVQSGSCASANSSPVTITVTPSSVGGSVNAAATVCSGSNGATLNLTGATGSVTGWESSLDNFATAGTPVVNTTTSLTYSNLTQTTSYRAVVQNGSCASANSSSVTITVTPSSVGGSVNAAATVCSGSNGATVNLTGATGSVTGWESSLDNFATAGTPVVNTTTSLTYSNLTQTTSYRAIVQNGSCAFANSSSVTITVSPVSIGGSVSASATVCSGSNGATLNLTGAAGSVTGWESSLDNFATAGTPIVNTTTSLTYSNLTQTTSYRAIVQNGSCASANSSSVTITVTPSSVGGSVNAAATVCSGSNGATVNLTGATGSVTSWESSLDNFATAGTPVVNTTTSLTYSNLTQTTSYRAVVQNGSCASANSASVTVTVIASVGGSVSSATTVCSGLNGGTVSLTGATGSVTGWESSLDNFATAGTPVVNTTTSLTYSNLTQTTSYRAIVQNGSCASANSSSVTITVTSASVGGTLSSAATVCSGANGATINLTGESGNVTGWEYSLDSFATAGVPIANTTTSLNYLNLNQTTSYRAVVAATGCSAVNSSPVTITVAPTSVGGSVSAAATVCSGANGATVNLTGETGSVTGWESSLDNFATAGAPIVNATTSLTYSNLTQTTSYRAIVKSGSCTSANSSSVTITVDPISAGGNVSSAATVCSGINGATINLAGETGSVTGWESSLDNFATAGTPIVNTTTGLTYSNLAQTTSYRAVVKSGSCASANSLPVTITVTPMSVGGSVSSATTVCSGANGATINLTGETGSVTGWESSLDNFATAGTPIANTTASLTYSNLIQTTSYRAIVKSGSCPSANSSPVMITTTPGSVGGTVSSAATECSGVNGATLSLTGQTGSVTGWESSLDNFATAGTPVVNTTTSLTYSNLTQTTSYRALVQNGGCPSDTSASVVITVTGASVGGAVNSSATECSGTNGATLNLTGATGSVTGWESSLDNFATAGTPIVNTTASLTYSNLTQTTSYRAVVQNGSCASVNSSPVTITVTPASVGGTVNSSATVCSGTNGATLNLTGETGSVIGWESSLDNFATAGTPVANTSTSLTYTNLTQTTAYRAIVKIGSCSAVNSSSVLITVTSDPSVIAGTLQSNVTVVNGKNNGKLTLTGYSGTILNWESSPDNFATSSAIANITDSLVYHNLTQTTYYRVVLQGVVCPSRYSNMVTVTVQDSTEALVIYPSLSPNGDNLNDDWVIDNINKYPDNNVSIFDRWGNIVFKEKGYNNTNMVWKGHSNAGLTIGNRELPDGTYYYIVDLGDGSKARSGYVVIKR
jgi:gliding motility-associated-like protein